MPRKRTLSAIAPRRSSVTFIVSSGESKRYTNGRSRTERGNSEVLLGRPFQKIRISGLVFLKSANACCEVVDVESHFGASLHEYDEICLACFVLLGR